MLVLRKNLNRPLAPSEMDGNFRLIDEALKRAEYGDGPYPVADYIFDGATVLPGGIDFSRPGDATYIRDGQLLTAGVDEPVFEDGGLRLWPQVTNYVSSNFWSTGRADSTRTQKEGLTVTVGSHALTA